MMQLLKLSLDLPGLPPSGNHYKAYRVIVPRGPAQKAFASFYLTAEAVRWKELVAVFASGKQVRGPKPEKTRYRITVRIHVGPGKRGDLDNFAKVLADSLQDCGVIHSDAAVDEWHLSKVRDISGSATFVVIEAI